MSAGRALVEDFADRLLAIIESGWADRPTADAAVRLWRRDLSAELARLDEDGSGHVYIARYADGDDVAQGPQQGHVSSRNSSAAGASAAEAYVLLVSAQPALWRAWQQSTDPEALRLNAVLHDGVVEWLRQYRRGRGEEPDEHLQTTAEALAAIDHGHGWEA